MNKPMPILLAEDEDHDVLFMQIALERAGVSNPLAVVRNGREAMAYLAGDGRFANRNEYPLPILILLDLRLPYVPGIDVLRWIRQQEALTRLPVIIHSSSDQERDVAEAYSLGADAYIVKPPNLSGLAEIVRLIKKYWVEAGGPSRDCDEWLSVTVRRPSGASRASA